MPSFDKLKFTANGLALQANAQAGGNLNFSKIKLGKGNTSGNISSLSDLVNPVIEAKIITGTLQSNVYTVQANATNERLTEGFYWTEIGLFATDNDGNEVLYAYSSTTDETDYIPSSNESSYLKRVKIAIAVGNASNIEITMSDDTYVDVLTFNEKINEIKSSLSEMLKQINDCATTKELDNVKSELEKQIEDAKNDLNDLENTLSKEIENIKNNYATTQSVEQIETTLSKEISDTDKALTDFQSAYNQKMLSVENSFSAINKSIETINNNISNLANTLNAMPSITSGTADPSGGEDGDVYIQHE